MGYIDPYTLQRYRDKTKLPEAEILTHKQYWVVLNNKGKIAFHKNGHLLIFANKKIAIDWFRKNEKTCESLSWKLERLTLCITRD